MGPAVQPAYALRSGSGQARAAQRTIQGDLPPDSRTDLIIDPGPRSISGHDAATVRFDSGSFAGERVYLGELQTDDAGRLLVLGGRGRSHTAQPKNPVTNFANNDGWHDDTADGPVTARITLADGSVVEAEPAAPLPAGGMALTGYHAPPGGRRGPPDWDSVTRAVRAELGDGVHWRGPPVRLSAASGQLAWAAGRHWAAVGDAACSFDPLASTGLLQALRGAARVAAALSLDEARQDEELHAYAGQVRALFARFTARRAMIYADMFAGEAATVNSA